MFINHNIPNRASLIGNTSYAVRVNTLTLITSLIDNLIKRRPSVILRWFNEFDRFPRRFQVDDRLEVFSWSITSFDVNEIHVKISR